MTRLWPNLTIFVLALVFGGVPSARAGETWSDVRAIEDLGEPRMMPDMDRRLFNGFAHNEPDGDAPNLNVLSAQVFYSDVMRYLTLAIEQSIWPLADQPHIDDRFVVQEGLSPYVFAGYEMLDPVVIEFGPRRITIAEVLPLPEKVDLYWSYGTSKITPERLAKIKQEYGYDENAVIREHEDSDILARDLLIEFGVSDVADPSNPVKLESLTGPIVLPLISEYE